MSQVMLQGPRILFIIRGFETTGMAKHVRMDRHSALILEGKKIGR